MMHRDYSPAGRTVTLAMFDDRLEVTSPGGLMRGMTLADLGTGKPLARNPTLAEAMRQMGWVERFGTGIRLIRREMKASGSAEPGFAAQADRFTVTLYARELDIWRNEGRRRYEWANGRMGEWMNHPLCTPVPARYNLSSCPQRR